MAPGGADTPAANPRSPLRITHDGEFYARLLTKESSLANPSFRYYGAGTAAAVPFGWESQPGTPKDASCCRMLQDAGTTVVVPAINPPPSYHLRAATAPHCRRSKGSVNGDRYGGGSWSKCCCCGYKKLKWIKIGFIAAVFRRVSHGKLRVSSSSSPVASVRSSSSSSTRWLFAAGSSSVEEAAAGAGGRDFYDYEPVTKAVLCLGVQPSPWRVQFCGGRRETAGWP